MKQQDPICQHAVDTQKPDERLMVQGEVSLVSTGNIPLILQRGMMLVTNDGVEVGTVAALVYDCEQQTTTQLLLCQLPAFSEYRRVPLEQIAWVDGEMIHLTAQFSIMPAFPVHQPT